jgi:hypothetical protein
VLATGERGLATEARTGRHALARTPPPRLREPGQAARRACDYLRRGPVTFRAHVAVAQGTLVAPSLGPPRTKEDVVTHIARTRTADPEASRWHCVVDTRKMHPAASLGRVVAAPDGMEADVGKKAKRGLLQSMAPRAACLADPPHNMVFHSPPKQAAWRHQIALWLRIVVRKLLQRARCTSGEDVHARVLAFLQDFHATMAKPFPWTYGQKPLSV